MSSTDELLQETDVIINTLIQESGSGHGAKSAESSKERTADCSRDRQERLYALVAKVRDDYVDEFEAMYVELELNETTAYAKFVGVTDSLVSELKGMSWGRIVTLLAFCSFVASKQEARDLVPSLKSWTKRLFRQKLTTWIEAQGGWIACDKKFHTSSPEWSAVSLLKAAVIAAVAGLVVTLVADWTERTSLVDFL